ncbi:MAG: hypothetical protein JWP69_2349 [Flaviaesturariibacter sp.]|nr:hypothetical protein [Flaviaesturariibacter sp.]
MGYFMDACRRGDEGDVVKMCELFPELINEQDSKGFSPLIIAVYNNQLPVVSVLLQNGAEVNAQDRSGNTALMGACFKGYKEAAELLVNNGADVNLLNGQNAPALTFAATFGQIEIAKLLLEHGADITVNDSRGKTPLGHAILQENEGMISLLQQYNKASG